MKKIVLLCFVFLLFPANSYAANKMGMHVVDESNLDHIAEIVNDDAEWGYVTLVIRDDEMDIARWQRVFDTMGQLKLTPIVRIATHNEEWFWVKPNVDDARDWAVFLDSLRWPTEERYVVLFNEPNHAKEWGGEINPREYALIARKYWEQLMRRSTDFFVLPAGFDQAAPNSSLTMDQEKYMQEMFDFDDLIFTLFDGWTSHSYPNPGFSGSPEERGRGTTDGFNWELSILKKYHTQVDLSVFITETGWAKTGKLGTETIKNYYKYALENVWSHESVKAVTPFLFNYQAPPFQVFSWMDENGKVENYYGNI